MLVAIGKCKPEFNLQSSLVSVIFARIWWYTKAIKFLYNYALESSFETSLLLEVVSTWWLALRYFS